MLERRTDIGSRKLIDTAIAMQETFGRAYFRFFLVNMEMPEHIVARVLASTALRSAAEPLCVNKLQGGTGGQR